MSNVVGDWKNMEGYEVVYESPEGCSDPVKIYVAHYPETLELLKRPENAKEKALFDEVGPKIEAVARDQRTRLCPETVPGLNEYPYEMVSGREGYGSKGRSGVKIYARRPPALLSRIEALDNDMKKTGGNLTPRERESSVYYRVASEVEQLVAVQAVRLDPKTWERERKTKADFEKAFTDAGLPPSAMEPIENKYWPSGIAEAKVGDPWYLVSTPIGVVEIGWRKRVINIDWSRTQLRTLLAEQSTPPHGEELLPTIIKDGETTTLGDYFVHAYGYEKATKYLRAMAEWKSKST